MIPRTEYALAEDGAHVAYQVFGDGGLDLVFVNRLAATIGYMWEIPDFARFLRRLGTMARVIALATFDGPVRAVRCAAAIMQALSDLGISIRAGVHTGEVEMVGEGSAGSLCP